MSMILHISVFIVLVCPILCQHPAPGRCPAKPDGNDTKAFDVNKYSGIWYEIERSANLFEIGLKCVTANYTLRSDGKLNVINKGVKSWNRTVSVEGTARIPDSTNPADLRVTFNRFGPEAPYWIASTDYNNYAIVISCVDLLFGLFRVESIWVLGRNPQLNQATLDSIHGQIQRFGYNPLILNPVDQKNCP